MSFLRKLPRLELSQGSRPGGRRARRNVLPSVACQLESLEERALLSIATISTLAGNGTLGFSGNEGPATAASISGPTAVVVDAVGNVYFADTSNAQVRKVVKATGNVVAVAGTGVSGNAGDGHSATNAKISNVSAMAIDSQGNLYLGDSGAHVVRMVNPGGFIYTVVGNGQDGNLGDGGAATAASIGSPGALAVDSDGNLYIADDSNNVVREVVKATGKIQTIAGTGVAGISPNGTPATAAQISSPDGLAFDADGNLYLSDPYNNVVREVVKATGKIQTIAGNENLPIGFSGDGGAATAAQLYGPYGLAFDAAGNLYIADLANDRVRQVAKSGVITTVAGNGTSAFSGDGGLAANAQLSSPWGVAVAPNGNLVIGDNANNRVRQVTFAPSLATTSSLSTTTASTVYGQAVTFIASVSPTASSTLNPGGSVQFTVDGVNFGAPVALGSQGQAKLTLANLAAGTHAIGANYTGDSYFATSSAAGLSQSVSKAVLVVKANAASGRAGDPLPALTASYSGFVNGDTPASLAAAPAVATTATTTSAAGTYPISVSGGSAQNYTITAVAGTLTLTPPIKPVSVKGLYTGSKLTGLTITFNGPLLASSVQQLANYIALAPGRDGKYGTKDDVKQTVKSAMYNASTNVVTLKLKAAVASTPGLRLQAGNLLNTAGGLVDGAHNGKPGSLLLATFKGKTVSF